MHAMKAELITAMLACSRSSCQAAKVTDLYVTFK